MSGQVVVVPIAAAGGVAESRPWTPVAAASPALASSASTVKFSPGSIVASPSPPGVTVTAFGVSTAPPLATTLDAVSAKSWSVESALPGTPSPAIVVGTTRTANVPLAPAGR